MCDIIYYHHYARLKIPGRIQGGGGQIRGLRTPFCAEKTAFGILIFSKGPLSQAQKICKTFAQCWTNVKDVGPTLYRCYTHVLCLLSKHDWSRFNQFYQQVKSQSLGMVTHLKLWVEVARFNFLMAAR